jgi:hypothetical protein
VYRKRGEEKFGEWRREKREERREKRKKQRMSRCFVSQRYSKVYFGFETKLERTRLGPAQAGDYLPG